MGAISTWHPSMAIRPPDEPERAPLPPPRSGVWVWTMAILVAIVALLGSWWVTKSSIFAMRSLHVTGERHLSRQDVARLGGLTASTDVLWLSTHSLEQRLRRSPWVASARITRTLPGSISIQIRERAPIAISKSGWLIAQDGVVLQRQRGSSTRFPVVDSGRRSMAPGERVQLALPQIEAVRSLMRSLRLEVESVRADAAGMVTLELRGGGRVLWGDTSDLTAKNRALAALIAWAARSGVKPVYIDLRAPSAPAILPVGAVTTPTPAPSPHPAPSVSPSVRPSPKASPPPSP